MILRCLTILFLMVCVVNCSLDYASLMTCQGTEEWFQGERCEIKEGEAEGTCVPLGTAPSNNSQDSDAALNSDEPDAENNVENVDLSTE